MLRLYGLCYRVWLIALHKHVTTALSDVIESCPVFETALRSEILPFYIPLIFGPDGVGKTTLLQEFSLVIEYYGAQPIYLGARHIELSPDSCTGPFSAFLGHHSGDSIPDLIDASRQWAVLRTDTYESLTPLDGLLRTSFLPQHPSRALTMFIWQSESGCQEMVRVISLRNLSRDEDCTFLKKHCLPFTNNESWKSHMDSHWHSRSLRN